MTSDADRPFALPRRDFLKAPSIRERAEAVKRAHSHSRLVSRLRVALPIATLGVVALYFISPQLHVSLGDLNASVEGVVIDKGNLRMVNPKLEGVNDKQGTYVVTARYAEQPVANPEIIYLTDLQADMRDAQKTWSRLTSPKGRFETKTEQLELIGDIRVAQSTGMKARLTRADVDMKARFVTSDQPVRVTFPSGTLDARTMRLNMGVREVEFRGDVRARMEQQKQTSSATEPEASSSSFAAVLKSGEPVDIAAPKLMVYDTQQLAHFQGGVLTVQGGSRMTSRELKVYYANDPAAEGTEPAPEDQGGSKLKLVNAIGNVGIVTADGRTAKAAQLTYDAVMQQLTLEENVIVTQAENTLRGKRMISDLASGITRFPPEGRVYGHFKPAEAAVADAVKDAASMTIEGDAHIDLSSTRGQPVDIEADSLTVFDKKRVAEFFGKVKSVQGTMTMRSRKLAVNYSSPETDEAGERQGGSKVTSIRAEGKVLINTGDNQTTTSDWALFDAAGQTVTIGGNVILSQDDNVIKGDELVIDLTTNRSRFVNRTDLPWKKERVRGLFMPQKSAGQ